MSFLGVTFVSDLKPSKRVTPKPRAADDWPVGTVFNPQVVQTGFLVRFEYEPKSFFEVRLIANGTLEVRMSGSHSDLISTHHHVANSIMLCPRRWNNEAGRHVELVKPEEESQ